MGWWNLITAAVEWDIGRAPQDVPYAEFLNKGRCTPLYNQPLHSHLLRYCSPMSTLHQNVVFVYWFCLVTHPTFHKLLHVINPVTTRKEVFTHKVPSDSFFHSLLFLSVKLFSLPLCCKIYFLLKGWDKIFQSYKGTVKQMFFYSFNIYFRRQ
jgi:hypothetical protein